MLKNSILDLDFLKKFDIVKINYNQKIKDNFLKEEIDVFRKYNIIDDNNMFNYINLQKLYDKAVNTPIEYEINIISNSPIQLSSFINKLLNNSDNINIFSNSINIIYETYLDFTGEKNWDKFNLYAYNNKINKDTKCLLLNQKKISEIYDYIIKNKEYNFYYIITKSYFNFTAYPSVKFIFHNINNNSVDCIKDQLYDNYISLNELLISYEKVISEEYFENNSNLYLNDQLSNRQNILLNIINLFLFDKENYSNDDNNIIKEILPEEILGYKNIILNNLFFDIINNILLHEVNYNFYNNEIQNDDNINNNFDIFEEIYMTLFTHFKTEMNFLKNSIMNFNSLINDHMKLTIDNKIISSKDKDITNYIKNSINKLIECEIEDYKTEKQKNLTTFLTNSKQEILNKITSLKTEINNKYIITDSYFNYLYTEISTLTKNYESQILNFIKETNNNNINIFYQLKKILNEQGIFSINFDELIKIKAIERTTIHDPIKDIIQTQQNSFQNILTTFGISGIIGGTASLIAGRAASVIGADVAAGAFGGPVGIGIGVVVGVGSLMGQVSLHYKNNRKKVENIFDDIENSGVYLTGVVENILMKDVKSTDESVENDLKEVRMFIDVLVDRVGKILNE